MSVAQPKPLLKQPFWYIVALSFGMHPSPQIPLSAQTPFELLLPGISAIRTCI